LTTTWRNRIVGEGEQPASQFVANPANWRAHPQAQRDAMRGALNEVGWVQRVVVNRRTGYLVDGHERVAQALQNGDAAVPYVEVDLDEAEEAYVLATLDPIGAMAATDAAKLDELLHEVQSGEAGVQAMLAELAEQASLYAELSDAEPPEPQIDRAEELNRVWQVERGQIWEIPSKTVPGKCHRVMCGDSTDAGDVAALMDGERAHIVYTDPPYGVDYEGGTKAREKLAGDDTTDLYAPACAMASRFSDEKAALYLWHAGTKAMAVTAAIAGAGYEIRSEIVWNKNLAQYGALSAQYKQKHEPLYYCFRRGHVPRWYGPTNEVSVWDCNRAASNEFHSTQKPPELAVRALKNSSMRGDVAMDLFLGGGATVVGAEMASRICYGMEKVPGNVAVTLQRLADMGLAPVLLERKDPAGVNPPGQEV
jgi:DNA modification methylase